MIDQKTKDSILKSIAYSGSLETNTKVVIVSKNDGIRNNILDLSSGAAKLRRLKFVLLFSKPGFLATFSNLEIHCCLCGKVISYPTWYYVAKYAVNHFHYFICCDPTRMDKPTIDCYRRD